MGGRVMSGSLELTAEEATLIRRTREVRVLSEEFIRIGYLERRRAEAFERFVAEDLIEHNPDFGDGREASARFFAERGLSENTEQFLPVEQWVVDFDQVLISGDLLFMRRHAFQRVNDPGRVFWDIWRWQGNQIVEHWDVIQDVPQGKANPRTMW
jgi:predicted SnoaL-like aldol condensation-catalyzing enzyme